MMKWQRGGPVLARHRRWLLPALVLGALVALWVMYRAVSSWFDAPDPTTIAEASLQSMREQNRMIVLSSQLTSTQTTKQRRGPFSYSRTLIMPGDVRYELDMAKLDQNGLSWNAETRTLSVTLPPIEVSQPQIDPQRIREIGDGGVLRGILVNDETLDQANMQAGLRELAEQARQPSLMRVARDNATRVMARNFALPLRAAGIDANVEVRFADQPRDEPSYMDGSTPLNEVMGRPVEVKGK
jgi:hypothetical protein